MESTTCPEATKRVVVIGNGMVGHRFCEKLISRNDNNQFEIIVFAEEPRRAYDRVHLSSYFADKDVDALYLSQPGWYEEAGITLRLEDPIVEIDKFKKNVISASGDVCPYDYLVFATGSVPFMPPVPGKDLFGVFVYRTIEDLELIAAHASRATRGAIVGGGLLGLEAAKAMMDLGLETRVVEHSPRLMPRQLDERAAEFLRIKLEHLGMQVIVDKNVTGFRGDGQVESIDFADGTQLEADIVVVSAGIRPRDELARAAGIKVGPRGGILVDEAMLTSDPHIFAIGECALFEGMIYGLVAPGYEMAEVAASRLAGIDKRFAPFDMSTQLKLLGVDVASFGDPFGNDTAHSPVIYEDRTRDIYKRINVSEDGKRLLGGILVGDTRPYQLMLQTYRNAMALPRDLDELLFEGAKKEGPPGKGVLALPDTALICSCESVTKGAIRAAILEGGVTDLDGMKKCTRAGTGCGGCVPMVRDLIAETLRQQGHEVREVICEHFAMPRRDLYDMIRVRGIRTYEDALKMLGTGGGCEVCKPAVASILASAWNEQITAQPTIQDTNDRYLANIQKGGTYSVVPRVPGGEITPEKLIVLGKVAKKYKLYCKITGGQRIDLLGAHVHQLPLIWEELIRAGFESGHAYGKSVRTVKSCVGSTWCRYGLHDSVGLAIELEERYKGLRSPHKIKMGVSGCIRECAEAQSKDIGVIATEKGWNLFVCGNGGAKPRHAVLLASDIDKETLIRYIDRVLMYYIMTAEPLTRTSTWLAKLDGGLDYLKRVVIADELDLCGTLESEMARILSQYACEWKTVVETPELRRQYAHFVNSPDPDPTVSFRETRTQRVPAGWE